MMKNWRFLLAIVLVAVFIGGCKYDWIIPEEVIDPDDPNTEEISFSTEILPIFTEGNNCTACHKTGSQIPDLTAGNAYSAINSTRYINTSSPEESRIYTVAHPERSGHSQKKYTNAQAALILTWIKQGAKNN
jgi:hypothetical protein